MTIVEKIKGLFRGGEGKTKDGPQPSAKAADEKTAQPSGQKGT